MASRILGMGDVLSLIEEAQRKVDHKKAQALAKKLHKGKGFDLEDLRDQMVQMQKMGGVAGLMDKLPAMGAAAPKVDDQAKAEKEIRRTIAIINSMTIQERRNPDIIKASRKRRIAAGCGYQVQDVNRLLKQHLQMSQVMKQFSKGGLRKLMSGLKGKLPPGGGFPPMGGFSG